MHAFGQRFEKKNSGVSVQPRLLQEGEHYIDSYLFKYDGLRKVSDSYIEHGVIHQISVEKGSVAKVFQDNLPRLLGEGDHSIESTNFSYHGMLNIVENLCISHGTITVLQVTEGKIALCWKNSEPTFFSRPGFYEFDSPDFSFVEFKNAEEQLIQLGSKKIIMVQTGQVGVTYDEGQLKILKSGRHMIDSSTHVFHRLLSTQQRSIRLASFPANEREARKSKFSGSTSANSGGKLKIGNQDADLTICETKDLVKVGMRMFFTVSKIPKSAFKRLIRMN